MNELAGMVELARLFGLSRQRVQQLARKRDFPQPIAVLEMGKVWHLRDIRDWAERTNRPTPELDERSAFVPSEPRTVVGAAELAKQFRVSRQRVQQIAATNNFPRPAATLTMGRLWYEDDCQKWDRARKAGVDEG